MKEKYEIKLSKSTILLAEDEETVRESFKKVLLLYVDKVYTACDGEEALELYKRFNPDIIITDLKMPKLNGLDLIKLIRKENQEIPIIVTSAHTDQEFLLESIKLSLIEYAIKPITERIFLQLLESCAKTLFKNSKTIISFNSDFNYNFDKKLFSYKNQYIQLTNNEIGFIEILLAHRGSLVTKTEIEDKLYIYEEAAPSAVKNLVCKLRKKLQVDIIKTVSKIGYMIE